MYNKSNRFRKSSTRHARLQINTTKCKTTQKSKKLMVKKTTQTLMTTSMIYAVINKSTTLSCWPHSRPYYSFTRLFFYVNFALWSFTRGSLSCQLQFSMYPYLYFKIIHTVGNDVSELTWFPWKAFFLLHKLTAPPCSITVQQKTQRHIPHSSTVEHTNYFN